jgi:hypothetical protein
MMLFFPVQYGYSDTFVKLSVDRRVVHLMFGTEVAFSIFAYLEVLYYFVYTNFRDSNGILVRIVYCGFCIVIQWNL